MDKEIEHGKLGSYTNEDCRCEKCKEANRKYLKEYRRKNRYNEDGDECELRDCKRKGMLIRGLCMYHYNIYLSKVNDGKITWQEVELKKGDNQE